MSDPKFAVGDLVAVCAMFPLHGSQVVIPKTVVTGRHVIRRGVPLKFPLVSGHTCWPYADQWVYYYEGGDYPTREINLRPYTPGEYLNSTQDQAIKVGA